MKCTEGDGLGMLAVLLLFSSGMTMSVESQRSFRLVQVFFFHQCFLVYLASPDIPSSIPRTVRAANGNSSRAIVV